MHLARDYIHPYKDAGGRPAHCRVRIYLPDDTRDAPVVICSELPNNPGESVTNSAEVIAAGVIRANELPTPVVWIEHWPEEPSEGQETFELVVLSSYEVSRGLTVGVLRCCVCRWPLHDGSVPINAVGWQKHAPTRPSRIYVLH